MTPTGRFDYRGLGLLDINLLVAIELLADTNDLTLQIMGLSMRSRLKLSTITKEPP